MKFNDTNYHNTLAVILLFCVPIFFVHEKSQIIKYVIVSITAIFALIELSRMKFGKGNKKPFYVLCILLFLIINFLIRNDYQRVFNLLEAVPAIIIIVLNSRFLQRLDRPSFLLIQRSGLFIMLLVIFLQIVNILSIYPDIEIFQLPYYNRIAGGQNNIIFYIVYSLYMSSLLSDFNNAKIYWPNLLISVLVVFTSHSRQAIVAIFLYLTMMTSRKLSIFLLLIFSSVFLITLTGHGQLIYNRTLADVIDGGNYRRLLMNAEALVVFLSDPLSLNRVKGLEMAWGSDVFDNSFTDLAVRSGLFGLLGVISLILSLLAHNRIMFFKFVSVFVVMALFNEVVYEPGFWIALSCSFLAPASSQKSSVRDKAAINV